MKILPQKLKESFTTNRDNNISKKAVIVSEIQMICDEMNLTDMWFQLESDPDLIDACIYKREMLNAKYRYLINKIKPRKV